MLFDFLVHQRLGCARLVGFVVAVTAIAHQVDEDIAFEGITEIQRQTGNESNRFRSSALTWKKIGAGTILPISVQYGVERASSGLDGEANRLLITMRTVPPTS